MTLWPLQDLSISQITAVWRIERNLTLFGLYVYNGDNSLPYNSRTIIFFLRRCSLRKPDGSGIRKVSPQSKIIHFEHGTYKLPTCLTSLPLALVLHKHEVGILSQLLPLEIIFRLAAMTSLLTLLGSVKLWSACVMWTTLVNKNGEFNAVTTTFKY